MTTPNLGPGDIGDYDEAANNGSLSDLQGANPSDYLRGQLGGMTGPVGFVGAAIMGALGNIVDDVVDYSTDSGQKNLGNARTFALGRIGDTTASMENPAAAAITAIINGVFNGWFGGGGVGEPQQVQYTIEAIKDAVINGYLVQTFVEDGVWTKPDNLSELVVIGIGGGRNGGNGSTSVGGPGGLGGDGGGYVALTLDPADVPSSVAVTIGAAGQPTTFGDLLEVDGGAGGIAGPFGFTPTNSVPGRGGDGGAGSYLDVTNPRFGEPGQPGEASALGASGAAGVGGGSYGNGGAGGAGGNVSPATATKCGGGGGTASSLTTRNGGAGGPGGYPGGGGGGGGGRGNAAIGGTSNAGAGGPGAHGVLWVFSKIGRPPLEDEE